ncbi:hypothetical protein FOA52_009693 [Chlamydomonas sp. UWO 241]|nr:hypothetical protein FOA52_009693 [Chlamydomonas sp. UWO 241]
MMVPRCSGTSLRKLEVYTKLKVDNATCLTIQLATDDTFRNQYTVALTELFTSRVASMRFTNEYPLVADVADIEIVSICANCASSSHSIEIATVVVHTPLDPNTLETGTVMATDGALYPVQPHYNIAFDLWTLIRPHVASLGIVDVTLVLLYTSTPPPSSSNSPSTGVIVGTVVGGAAALVLLAGAGFFIYSRMKLKATRVVPAEDGSADGGHTLSDPAAPRVVKDGAAQDISPNDSV